MREIKFRAWDGEKIVEDLLLNHDGKTMLWLDGKLDGTGHDDWKSEGLMQFTGLKDGNGKEIYDGDILSPERYVNDSFGNAIVEFKDGMFCFAINKPFISSTKPLITSVGYGDKAGNKFIVIGNIHENIELIND